MKSVKPMRMLRSRKALSFPEVAIGLALLLLLAIVIAIIIDQYIYKRGGAALSEQFDRLGDADSDGIANFQDACCPAQCRTTVAVDTTLGSSLLGCAPDQKPTHCADAGDCAKTGFAAAPALPGVSSPSPSPSSPSAAP